MNTMELYDRVCLKASRQVMPAYSTSFSLGVRLLHRRFRDPIHAIYGFVRFADEIVDTFHQHDQRALLARFREDTDLAVARGISLNPLLHSYQRVVHHFGIERELYGSFLQSMGTDLVHTEHDRRSYQEYILGSAESVGLMCLRVFCEGDDALYQVLKPSAMRLGSAFQKVNFLRDLNDDRLTLGRTYFPGVSRNLTATNKMAIEQEIEADFDAGLGGIRKLPKGARLGVYMAYLQYKALLKKMRRLSAERMPKGRVRINDRGKLALLTAGYVRHSFGML